MEALNANPESGIYSKETLGERQGQLWMRMCPCEEAWGGRSTRLLWERTRGGACVLMHLHPRVEAGEAQLSSGILLSLQEAGMGRGVGGTPVG